MSLTTLAAYTYTDSMPPLQDEIIDIVDEQNHVTGIGSKHAAHRAGLLHRTVIGEVRDPKGNIVLVRQSADRQDAGQFVVPVGGHVKFGETDDEALKRETLEEIGLRSFSFTFLDRFIYERHVIGRHENHYFIVYQIVADSRRFILGSEATEHRTFSIAELKGALIHTPEIFGASYLILLQRCFPELLS
jgi:8-oxo-dGTP pyrophosphatase MutT (NUDIX family)